MKLVFKTKQENEYNFRSQLVKVEDDWVLWIAENDEEVYAVNFDELLAIDVYSPKENSPLKVLVLYKYGDEIDTVEIGSFSQENAMNFISWMSSNLFPLTS